MKVIVSFTPRRLYPQGKNTPPGTWHVLDRSLCEPQSWFGSGGEEKNSGFYRESNAGRPARSLAT